MNQLIEKLAEQAKLMAEEDINKQISYNAELKAFAEKFAELIVGECITVARGADGLDATHEAWYLIEQHFGVGMSTEDKKTLIKQLLGVEK